MQKKTERKPKRVGRQQNSQQTDNFDFSFSTSMKHLTSTPCANNLVLHYVKKPRQVKATHFFSLIFYLSCNHSVRSMSDILIPFGPRVSSASSAASAGCCWNVLHQLERAPFACDKAPPTFAMNEF